MTPRILNLQARPPSATELCAPDVHYFPVGDPQSVAPNLQSFVAFDSNTLVAVEISKAQHEALTRQRASAVRPGQPSAADDNPPPALLFSRRRPKFDLGPDISCRQLTLHLSDQCNQRCSYCWIEKPSTAEAQSAQRTDLSESRNAVLGDLRVSAVNPPVMTRQIAAAALKMFPDEKLPGRDLRIGFFGGEPLLHFGMIVAVCEMAEKLAAARSSHALFHVTTNATLVTPIVAKFLAERGFSIIVSCDGPKKLHDAARGAGSYAAMRRGLNMLHNAGCSGRVVLRGTWSGMPAEILARLHALNRLAADSLAAGVALEPVAGAMFGPELDAEIRSACDWFGVCARSGGSPHWQYLEKTLQRVLWQQFRASECGAGRGYYTVGPTGIIYACHKQQNSEIGRIWDGAPVIDEARRGKWLDNRFCSRRECSLCWARHVCGGACRSESLEFCGGITKAHAGRCLLMRRIVAEALRLAATLPREALLRICPAPEMKNCG